MNEVQVIQTVDLIYSEYPFFKFEDFKLCFNNAKIGKYGISYDRVDGQIIFEWLNTYSNERALEAERMNINTHASQIRNESEKIDINPEGQKKVIEILKSVLETKPPVIVIKELYKKTPKDEFIQKCFRDFDDLCARKPSVDKNGQEIRGKYTDMKITDTIGIDYKGIPITKTHVRPVDVTEYTNEKLTEYNIK